MLYFICIVRLNVNDVLLFCYSNQRLTDFGFQQVELMDPQRTGLKHTDYYLRSENNASTPSLAVVDGSKFLRITFRCVEVKKKF